MVELVIIDQRVEAIGAPVPPWSRNSRFWAAHGGDSVTLPEIIVDSGHQHTNGYEDFYSVYKGMVDAELTRPPQATVDALWWRDGNRVQFYVTLTNLTSATLSAWQ